MFYGDGSGFYYVVKCKQRRKVQVQLTIKDKQEESLISFSRTRIVNIVNEKIHSEEIYKELFHCT